MAQKFVSLKRFVGKKNAINGFFQINRLHLRRLGFGLPLFYALYMFWANFPERRTYS